jgi:hypothetical protein
VLCRRAAGLTISNISFSQPHTFLETGGNIHSRQAYILYTEKNTRLHIEAKPTEDRKKVNLGKNKYHLEERKTDKWKYILKRWTPKVGAEGTNQRLNMELDTKVHFGSCVQLYSLAETPQLPPYPPAFGLIYTRALLVSQDRRHHFVTP